MIEELAIVVAVNQDETFNHAITDFDAEHRHVSNLSNRIPGRVGRHDVKGDLGRRRRGRSPGDHARSRIDHHTAWRPGQ